MKLLFFCPRWGREHLSWNDFLHDVKHAGYDGVECSLPDNENERTQLIDGLRTYGLQWIGQHWQTMEPSFEQHLPQYTQRLQELAALRPLFINSQTGKDYFSFEENQQLIQSASNIAASTGVAILHETHRGKFSFAAHITHGYLQRLPDVRITLDISHWCAVAETFLHDQQTAVKAAIRHTDHIHARIGHTQGAQVIDPRAPENAKAWQFHLQCWDAVIDLKRKKGDAVFTITPEFGAPPYLHLFPYTGQPIVSQWDVNVFMMELLRKRYE